MIFAHFSGFANYPPLNPGTLALISKTNTTITVDFASPPSGGITPFAYASDDGSNFNVGISLPYTFTGLTPGTPYSLRILVYDSHTPQGQEYTPSLSVTTDHGFSILREDDSYLLREDGSRILLEA